MTLGELLDRAAVRSVAMPPAPSLDAERLRTVITDVAYDSRHVGPGSIFVGLRGLHADGATFAHEAASRGAVAVIAESMPIAGIRIPWLVVEDARGALAALAATFFGNPSGELLVIGVTGTNGKTTSTYLMGAMLDRAGLRAGRVGTVAYRIGAVEHAAVRTTPESRDVQALLRQMVDVGCRGCVMEVSSHALMLRRADCVRFAAAVFTNLTRDHLDFHGDMDSYFRAKKQLFDRLPDDGVAVINADDPRGATLVATVRRPVTYAIDARADVRPTRLEYAVTGTVLEVRTPRGTLSLTSKLVGRSNAYNILAAAATCTALDVPFSAIEQGVADLTAVPGRMQVVSTPADDVTVIVDYAHTDDALRGLLETARSIARRRIITIFGCGGDRDRTKRPLMGAVAARLSDLVIITSDNPRSEDPLRIIEEIKLGIESAAPHAAREAAMSLPARASAGSARTELVEGRVTPWRAIVDRREAIDRAIREADPGDMVLIAGKGHEREQIIGERHLPFDDGEVGRDALARRRSNRRVG
jgi:UDP-N-acetylmuramoyl-L-alanyl-D-glutamate--2,6-diaminopimelate ligase